MAMGTAAVAAATLLSCSTILFSISWHFTSPTCVQVAIGFFSSVDRFVVYASPSAMMLPIHRLLKLK